jgi:hypothetical protein
MSNARYGLRVRNGLVQGITEGLAAIDADALAFINAAGITDATQIGAIYTLVAKLKTYGLWSKMKAIYPFVGGTASSHKFNLKDPQDTNAAFRLQFFGGVTHSANGVQFNGTNAYADTFLDRNTLVLFDGHLSLYSRVQALQTNNIDIGCAQSPNVNQLYNISIPRSNGSGAVTHTSQALNTHLAIATGQTSTQGFFMGNRLGSGVTDLQYWRNGNILATSTTNGTNNMADMPSIFIGALNNVAPFNLNGKNPEFFSNKQFALASIGKGLTISEGQTYNTIVQTFQTSLGRQV